MTKQHDICTYKGVKIRFETYLLLRYDEMQSLVEVEYMFPQDMIIYFCSPNQFIQIPNRTF